MPSKPPTYFAYHACANAFSGHFTRPFVETIDVQAGSSLPVTGGHGSSCVENFQFHKFISFRRGYTHVSGGFQDSDSSNNTLVTSVLENLNMLDILTAGRIVCRLYSKHPQKAPEGRITMHGSLFQDLAICGHPVRIDLDFALFEDIQTYEQAQAAYKSNAKFKKIASDPLQSGHDLPEQKCNGAFLCSLVKDGGIQLNAPGVKVAGHSIYVPGFGKVFFAEVMISHGTRTLTMLRFELGSTSGGGGTGGSGTTNGKHYPPGG